MMITIRKAILQDLDAITAIYNGAIINTVATFDIEPKSREEQLMWFNSHGDKCIILVAEAENKVTGWASLSKWSDRCAYSDTAECSLYIDEKHRNHRIGSQLMQALLKAAGESGFHTLIARIVEGNDVSIHMCESLGFRQIGVMREVGRKFGKLLDVVLLQIILD